MKPISRLPLVVLDPEGIALTSKERCYLLKVMEQLIKPFIKEFHDLWANSRPRAAEFFAGCTRKRGIRNNLAFEPDRHA